MKGQLVVIVDGLYKDFAGKVLAEAVGLPSESSTEDPPEHIYQVDIGSCQPWVAVQMCHYIDRLDDVSCSYGVKRT